MGMTCTIKLLLLIFSGYLKDNGWVKQMETNVKYCVLFKYEKGTCFHTH
jgi:hypothetical protein